ncbi:MAG: phytanoyl-CoA dioxygenase family protein [Burkholderiaceae bacterium]|nr:phytanoyl-CoA dioxygenase family protein [Burkholderiaceae bacterium]
MQNYSAFDDQVEFYAAEIRKNGFVLIPSALDDGLVDDLLSRIRYLNASLTPVSRETIPYLNRGHEVVYSLENKDLAFVRAMFNHPVARGVKIALLNDQWYKQIPAGMPNYILRAMIARSGGPEPLPLHIDSFVPSSGSFSWAVQVAFILEDQSIDNGCTVFVPGSHLFDRYANQEAIAQAVAVEPKKGDMVIWDSRTWHGTRGNLSGKTRWSFIGTFTRWWIKQNYDTVRNLPDSIYKELSDEERSILGFCSSPPFNEYQRIDIKGGYELISERNIHDKQDR